MEENVSNMDSHIPNKEEFKITNEMLDSAKGIGPWNRFFSILGFIGSALMILGGIFMLIVPLLSNSFGNQFGNGMGTGFFIIMGIFYLLGAILYLFMSIFLFKAASGIVQLKNGEVKEGLELFLASQKKFWKITGIITICFLALYPIMMIILISTSVLRH